MAPRLEPAPVPGSELGILPQASLSGAVGVPGVTVALAGQPLDAALQRRELLLEAACALEVGSLLRRQQLLHLPHGAEHLLVAQALLGEGKVLPVNRRAAPCPLPCRRAALGDGWDALSSSLPIPPRGLSLLLHLLQPQPPSWPYPGAEGTPQVGPASSPAGAEPQNHPMAQGSPTGNVSMLILGVGSLPGCCRGAAAGHTEPPRLAAGRAASRRGWLLPRRLQGRDASSPVLPRSPGATKRRPRSPPHPRPPRTPAATSPALMDPHRHPKHPKASLRHPPHGDTAPPLPCGITPRPPHPQTCWALPRRDLARFWGLCKEGRAPGTQPSSTPFGLSLAAVRSSARWDFSLARVCVPECLLVFPLPEP